MQSRERQLHLRLHSERPHHAALRRPRGQVVQQHGLAGTRLATHDQGPALASPHGSNEPVEHPPFAVPVRQP